MTFHLRNCRNIQNIIPINFNVPDTGKNFHPPSAVTVESHSFSFTECSGSCHPHRTGALWAARSSSAGRPDPPSSQCFPSGGDLTSGRRPPRTTSGTKKNKNKNQKWASSVTHIVHEYPQTRTRIYLAIRKLAVLHVETVVEGPDTGVGVVVGVFAHAVGETLLQENVPQWNHQHLFDEDAGDSSSVLLATAGIRAIKGKGI